MADVTLRRYVLPHINSEGCAEIVLGSNGFFAAVSDFGNYAFRWPAHGCADFRQFFLSAPRDWTYFASKLSRDDTHGGKVYDGAATLRNVHARIVELRRGRHWSKERARAEWVRAESFENLDTERDFGRWLELTSLQGEDAYGCHAERYTAPLEAFCTKTLARLGELLRAELEAEAAEANAPRDCTCMGSCKGATGLAPGWRCVLTKEPSDV